MSADLLFLGLAWFVVFLFSTTLHEAAHALAAQRLGDETAYRGGQVSLNPAPHIQREPVGMVVVPLISFALTQDWMFGWASAPYDPRWAERYPRKAAWMALAGPVANLLIVLVSGLAIRIGLQMGAFFPPDAIEFSRLVGMAGADGATGIDTVLSILFSLNLVLFLFNLLPFPPMDGSAVIQLLMPDEVSRKYQSWLRQPAFALAGLILAWNLFPYVFQPVLGIALRIIYPEIGYQPV